MKQITLEQARAAKTLVLEVFKPLVDVVGVGITRIDSNYAVKVNLRTPPPAGISLPVTVNDVPVCVEVVGSVRLS